MQTAAALTAAFSVDRRWLWTGLALALLLCTVCRAIGKVTALFGERLIFHAECAEVSPAGSGTALYVRFQDGNGISRRAALCTASPRARSLAAGDRVKIAVERQAFRMGGYPQTVPEAAESRDVLLLPDYRADRRKRLILTLIIQLLLCGAALALFLAVRQHFFA